MKTINHFILKFSTKRPDPILRQARSMRRAIVLNGVVMSAASGPAKAMFRAQEQHAKRLLSREGYDIFKRDDGGLVCTYQVRVCDATDNATWQEVSKGSIGIPPEDAGPKQPGEPPQQDGRS